MTIATAITTIRDFLLRERTLPGRALPSKPRRRRTRQRGVALIAVMIAIAVTLVIANEFGTSTNGDMMAAANYRDQMRSHFLARSSVNFAELVIRIQQRIDKLQPGLRITDFADQIMLAFCGNPEEVQAAIGMSSSDIKGLGADIGTCGVVGAIGTEDDKLNVNCANAANWKPYKTMLDTLIYFQAYDPVFEDADAENYRRDRATQAAAIFDYADTDNVRVRDFGTTEDYGYESLKDRYKPKNNYLDTVGELRLARGVDDRFWSLFGSAFTAYGACTINLSTLSNPQLIASVLLLGAEDPNDPLLKDPARLFMLANLVAKARQFGMSFSKAEEFVDFVKDPVASLGALAGKTGTLGGSQASSALGAGLGIPPGVKLGIKLKLAAVKQIASAGPLRTYRVEAWGEIDRKQKNADGSPVFPPIRTTITGVWDIRVTPQQARKPSAPKGAWVFLRED